MKTISLAIPFYNTSKYFLDCIKYVVDDDFVSEIVVNDDCSKQEEYDNLLSLVDGKNKIKVYRNEKNLGAFRNKYVTVKNCTNQWVYLLDSDNHPFEETYRIIRTIPDDNPLICYSPRQLFCKNDDKIDYENISDYTFKYDVIGVEETKDAIFKQTKWFDWFINSGNYVINRQMYLDSLKHPFYDENTPLLHADTAAVYYFWLKNGGEFVVVDDLRHNHRLRSESYWNACGTNSMQSVNYYKEQMINL
jgi:glycosyltransferase involved in cell wall biosynthesis